MRYGTQRAILFSPAAPCAADLMRLARQARLLERFGGKRDGRAWDKLLKVPLYPYQREGVMFASQAAWDVLHMRDVMRC